MFEKIYDHPLINRVIDNLTYNQFFSRKNIGQVKITIEFEDVRKTVWLVSILSMSKDQNHLKKALLLCALIYLQNQDNNEIERACFIIFSRAGNLIGTRLFNSFSNRNEEFLIRSLNFYDTVLALELDTEWHNKSILVAGEKIISSSFQKELWDELSTKSRISISAPTSAGKSFIIKKHIKRVLLNNDEYIALYIVPTRALINQVSEEFRNEINLDEVEIKTAYLEDDFQKSKRKQIYVLTPERCLRLIQLAPKQNLVLNLIFIDEIQNLENEDGRGSLFEYIFNELASLFNSAQIIIAGPNITNSESLFKDIFNDISTVVRTIVSPVFQIKTVIRPLPNNQIRITLKSFLGREQRFDFTLDQSVRSRLDKKYGSGISAMIDLFTNNDQNIIYSPRTDYVEDWALEYLNTTAYPQQANDLEIQQLIEFLQEEIHPKYYLIKCLEKKIAFHHSKLPDIVRKEIEDNYLSGKIKNLFCTSTLLEGVNLPANNLFIVSAKKLNEELSPFEFGNLIGRAGRIKDSLYGTIYCIEKDSKDAWAEEYYDKSYEKEVVSVIDKSLKDFNSFMSFIDNPTTDSKHTRYLSSLIFLRHKYLNNSNELENFIQKKNIKEDQKKLLIAKLSISMQEVKIPLEVAKLNPSVDPLLQNIVYKRIRSEGVEKWAITTNKNFYTKILATDKDSYQFKNLSLYWQLVDILERLDLIFNIKNEAYFKHNISASIRQICFYGLRWLNNETYKTIIEGDIKFHSQHRITSKRIDPNDEKAVNKRINEIIKINSTLVSYVLVKYLKLLNDILESLMTEDQKAKYKFSLGLPTMLELGSSEPTVKTLISRGVSRSVALKVFAEFKKLQDFENLDVFQWLKSKSSLSLKPLYNRYLKRLNLLGSEPPPQIITNVKSPQLL